jgi:hypothetical protein
MMEVKAKWLSNIVKVVLSLTIFTFTIVLSIVNKKIPSVQEMISLTIMIAVIWAVWLPVDASVFVKNLKDIKDITK